MNALQVPKGQKPANNKKTAGQLKSRSEGGSVSGNAGALEAALKLLEKEQREKEKALEVELILREKRLEIERALDEKRQLKEKEFREKQLQHEGERKERQLHEEREMLEKELAEEEAFQERRRKMCREFQNAKKVVNRDSTGVMKEGEDGEPSFDQNVKVWLKKQTGGKSSPLVTATQVASTSKQYLVKSVSSLRAEEEEESDESGSASVKEIEDEEESECGSGKERESDVAEKEVGGKLELSLEERKTLSHLLAVEKQQQLQSN
ncbi:protein split ends-like [Wyeomyia smithii]|uniref:protein split ends-like n=1 Tax=Wyeomyia smithii TaxID=174621 RepID=UPI002467C02E|nr:protein split ends-like [Wyeomyia smithii]